VYDVLFLHPPSVFDFRKRVQFLGPIARTVPHNTPVFIMFPIGLLSIANYLDTHGYKLRIVNLGEKMLLEEKFGVEEFLKKVDAKVFGVDLHWCVHSHGAIEIAKLCKSYHPSSLVVLGGLTATRFHAEILSKYPFIDAIIRGEGEEAMLKLMQKRDKQRNFSNVPNLTYRKEKGKIHINNFTKPPENLDKYNFAKLDLVEPNIRVWTADFGVKKLRVGYIPVCRGCVFNCVTCGGSSYSYRKLMHRSRPAFRSPEKVVEDFQQLDEQRIDSIFLFQDARMGGKSYYRHLIKTLHNEKWSRIEHVTMELFYPADDTFLTWLSKHKPADKIGLTISPESGVEKVRKVHGRRYSNNRLLQTVRSCVGHKMPIAVFFMIGLAEQTHETLDQTWSLWNKLLSMSRPEEPLILVDFGPMILLDPGSLAFDFPEKYGYRLIFKKFEDFYHKMQLPSWKHWISYESKFLKREDLTELILQSWERLLDLYEKHGFYTRSKAKSERLKISLERIILKEADAILCMKDEKEKEKRLRELKVITTDPLLSYSYILTHSGI